MKYVSLSTAVALLLTSACIPAKKPPPTAEGAPGSAEKPPVIETLVAPTANVDIQWREWAPYGLADVKLDWPSGAAWAGGKLYLAGTRKVMTPRVDVVQTDIVFAELSPAGVKDAAKFASHFGERAGAAVTAAPDGRIWFAGGFYTPPPVRTVPEGKVDYAATGTPVGEVDSWQPGDTALSFETCMPAGLGESGVVFEDGALFLVCGLNNRSDVADENNQYVIKYDPREGLWTKFHNYKYPTSYPGVTVTRKGLFVLGGKRLKPAHVTNQAFRYDLIVYKWQRVPALPAPRAAAKAVTVNDYIYLIGGIEAETFAPPGRYAMVVYRYGIKKQVWEKIPSPLPEGSRFVAFDGETFYLIGERKTYRGVLTPVK